MEIAAGISAATAALSTVKYIVDLDKALSQSELKLKMATLYSDLADVRMALSDAKDLISRLRVEVSSLESWDDEKRLYVLADAGRGAVVYRFDGADQSVPPHDLCPTCFQAGRKAILAPEERNPGRNSHLVCNTCKLDLIIEGSRDNPRR